MANVAAAFGFRPVRHVSGAPFNGQAQPFFIPASDGSQYFIGDLVKSAGNSDAATGQGTVILATAGSRILGAIVGFDVSLGVTPNLNIGYRPASTAMYAWVVTDPLVIYEVEMSGALAATDIGKNADLKTGTGSTVTNQSGYQLDSSTTNTTNTLGFHIMRAAQKPNNTIGANAVVEVLPNVHEYAFGTTGQ